MERRREIAQLDAQLLENFAFEGMLSRSPAMLEVFAKTRRVSRHFRAVLVQGETGSGKELVAKALHRSGVGADKPFIACNCSAIPESLIESELFGHVKGSFTGAASDKVGLFQAAHGGTLLLDEIGDMPMAQQARLLRVLQTREVQRVGSHKPEPVDVRIVAATHKSLEEMVGNGEFREDLYYRLSAVEISLPPLRERKEDLPMLFRLFVKQASKEYGKSIGGISRRAQNILTRYDWPGNVRELQNVISAACMMCERGFVDWDDLPDRVKGSAGQASEASASGWESLREIQVRHAARVLAALDGNKLQAAKVLGVSRATLYRMLESNDGPAGPEDQSDPFLADTSEEAVASSWERSIGLVR
jgi:transcriptional regulator with PAS, ATPase and Fis domain